MNVIRGIVLVAILWGVVGRGIMLRQFGRLAPPTVLLDRDDVVAIAKQRGSPFCFDTDAVVIMGVGIDGAPGRAGVDDNVDFEVDDAREMGAVPSDDQCLAPVDDRYDAVLSQPHTIGISRGTFVVCEDQNSATRYLTKAFGWVVVE